MKIVKKNKKASTTKIDIETLQGTTVKEITDVIVKENGGVFTTLPVIQSGTIIETPLTEVYELKVETKEKKTTTVKVTKDKKTQRIIVNDIKPQVVYPPVRPPVTVTQVDTYGNQETVITNKKVIK